MDFAIGTGIPHGGWCPKGRKAEDGPIPAQYALQEMPSADYLRRTEANVKDCDALLLFTIAEKLTGGSKRTAEFAEKHDKPWLHLSEAMGLEMCAHERSDFLIDEETRVLTVAGTRGSKEPGVVAFVKAVLSVATRRGDGKVAAFDSVG